MRGIDTPTASPTAPTPGSAGTAGFFVDGNPQTGVAGTVVSADWLNQVQGELLAIQSAAGITPSKTNNTQVLLSLQSLFGGGGTQAANGSRTLPGGTVIKWGNGSTTSTAIAGETVTFPGGAFPNGVYSIVVTERNATGWAANIATVFGTSAPTASGFNVHQRSITGGGAVAANTGVAYNWIAVGF